MPNYCLTELVIKPVKTPDFTGVSSAITTYESPALPLSYAAKFDYLNKLGNTTRTKEANSTSSLPLSMKIN
ncbi:MAG TPA: hypothetical protein VH878_04530 [Thermodesulfobacteriota bacterium]